MVGGSRTTISLVLKSRCLWNTHAPRPPWIPITTLNSWAFSTKHSTTWATCRTHDDAGCVTSQRTLATAHSPILGFAQFVGKLANQGCFQHFFTGARLKGMLWACVPEISGSQQLLNMLGWYNCTTNENWGALPNTPDFRSTGSTNQNLRI